VSLFSFPQNKQTQQLSEEILGETDIGHERIGTYLKECQKAAPRGVSLKRVQKGDRTYLSLQITLGTKRIERASGEPCTMQGITSALAKAEKVAEALKRIQSESEFLAWYEKQILKVHKIKNDLVTFAEAIAKAEAVYWDGIDKKRNKRERSNISQQATYKAVYGRFYALLPQQRLFNAKDLLEALNTKERGTQVYGDCLFAFKKLAVIVGHVSVIEALAAIKHTQIKFRELQNAELDSFLMWMHQCRLAASEKYADKRDQWLWVFSMQLCYGFRVHEVFAIQNLDKPFRTRDGVTIPALRDVDNLRMIAVVGDKTIGGTTTKTGYRLAAPMLPPSHPNLINELNIKSGSPPELVIKSTDPRVICEKYSHSAGLALRRSKAPITQTHALRHLANQNGKQAGISAEDRAANLGHSLAMNTSTYLKREATSTRLAAIDAQSTRTLPLEGAIAALKRIGADDRTITLVSEIYGVSVGRVVSMMS
jgi:hypothetical protein